MKIGLSMLDDEKLSLLFKNRGFGLLHIVIIVINAIFVIELIYLFEILSPKLFCKVDISVRKINFRDIGVGFIKHGLI